ncbi:hypothetical protein J6590_105782 [Homalodisca vitripennis]|nr:hypothetical protein J6590_105782 [Homalodisca vitripennis]
MLWLITLVTCRPGQLITSAAIVSATFTGHWMCSNCNSGDKKNIVWRPCCHSASTMLGADNARHVQTRSTDNICSYCVSYIHWSLDYREPVVIPPAQCCGLIMLVKCKPVQLIISAAIVSATFTGHWITQYREPVVIPPAQCCGLITLVTCRPGQLITSAAIVSATLTTAINKIQYGEPVVIPSAQCCGHITLVTCRPGQLITSAAIISATFTGHWMWSNCNSGDKQNILITLVTCRPGQLITSAAIASTTFTGPWMWSNCNSGDKQNIIWRPCCHSAYTMLWLITLVTCRPGQLITSAAIVSATFTSCFHSAYTMLWLITLVTCRPGQLITSAAIVSATFTGHWMWSNCNSGDKKNIVWRPCCHSASTMLWADNARHVQNRSTDNICSYCVSYIHWSLDYREPVVIPPAQCCGLITLVTCRPGQLITSAVIYDDSVVIPPAQCCGLIMLVKCRPGQLITSAAIVSATFTAATNKTYYRDPVVIPPAQCCGLIMLVKCRPGQLITSAAIVSATFTGHWMWSNCNSGDKQNILITLVTCRPGQLITSAAIVSTTFTGPWMWSNCNSGDKQNIIWRPCCHSAYTMLWLITLVTCRAGQLITSAAIVSATFTGHWINIVWRPCCHSASTMLGADNARHVQTRSTDNICSYCVSYIHWSLDPVIIPPEQCCGLITLVTCRPGQLITSAAIVSATLTACCHSACTMLWADNARHVQTRSTDNICSYCVSYIHWSLDYGDPVVIPPAQCCGLIILVKCRPGQLITSAAIVSATFNGHWMWSNCNSGDKQNILITLVTCRPGQLITSAAIASTTFTGPWMWSNCNSGDKQNIIWRPCCHSAYTMLWLITLVTCRPGQLITSAAIVSATFTSCFHSAYTMLWLITLVTCRPGQLITSAAIVSATFTGHWITQYREPVVIPNAQCCGLITLVTCRPGQLITSAAIVSATLTAAINKTQYGEPVVIPPAQCCGLITLVTCRPGQLITSAAIYGDPVVIPPAQCCGLIMLVKCRPGQLITSAAIVSATFTAATNKTSYDDPVVIPPGQLITSAAIVSATTTGHWMWSNCNSGDKQNIIWRPCCHSDYTMMWLITLVTCRPGQLITSAAIVLATFTGHWMWSNCNSGDKKNIVWRPCCLSASTMLGADNARHVQTRSTDNICSYCVSYIHWSLDYGDLVVIPPAQCCGLITLVTCRPGQLITSAAIVSATLTYGDPDDIPPEQCCGLITLVTCRPGQMIISAVIYGDPVIILPAQCCGLIMLVKCRPGQLITSAAIVSATFTGHWIGDKQNIVWRPCCHSACTMLWADNARQVQTRTQYREPVVIPPAQCCGLIMLVKCRPVQLIISAAIVSATFTGHWITQYREPVVIPPAQCCGLITLVTCRPGQLIISAAIVSATLTTAINKIQYGEPVVIPPAQCCGLITLVTCRPGQLITSAAIVSATFTGHWMWSNCNSSDKQNIVWRPLQTRSTDNICSYCISNIHWSLECGQTVTAATNKTSYDDPVVIPPGQLITSAAIVSATFTGHWMWSNCNSGDKQNIIWRPCCHSACTMLWADNARHVQTRPGQLITSAVIVSATFTGPWMWSNCNSGDKQNIIWRPCCHSACTMLWADNARHVQTRSTDNICSYCVSYIHWSLDVLHSLVTGCGQTVTAAINKTQYGKPVVIPPAQCCGLITLVTCRPGQLITSAAIVSATLTGHWMWSNCNSGDKQNTVRRPRCHSACTMLWADNARHVQTRSTDNICSYCVSYIHWSLDVVKL